MSRPVLGAIIVALSVLCAPLWTEAALAADKRAALIIGNSSYQNAPALPNPTRDARAIAAMFAKAGYDVVSTAYDLDNLDFKRAIRQFEDAAADADIAVVYYAGHGIEIHGVNYVLPVDVKLATDRDADDEAITLDRLIESVDGAKKLRVIILDACRDNPFSRTMRQQRMPSRGITAGLTATEPTSINTLVAYSAKAGSQAEDGNGDHSPFAMALMDNLFVPGLDVRLAFGRVRDEVLKKTSNRQEPFVYGSLGGGNISLVAGPDQAPTPAANDPNGERSDYALVEKVGTRGAWQVFLTQHPTGFYADLARQHLAMLATDPNNNRPQGGSNTNVAAAPNVQPEQKPTAPATPITSASAVTAAPNKLRDAQLDQKQLPAIATSVSDSTLNGPPNTWLWWWPQWR